MRQMHPKRFVYGEGGTEDRAFEATIAGLK